MTRQRTAWIIFFQYKPTIMLLVFIHLFFILINPIEAKLETFVIAMKNPNLPNYKALNRLEHRWSAIYYAGICVLALGISALVLGLTWKILPAAFSLLVNRRIFFEYSLKLFRRRSIKAIEGDQPLDKAIRKLLGVNGGYLELGLLFTALISSYFIIFKHS
jgi:hypothetical protein